MMLLQQRRQRQPVRIALPILGACVIASLLTFFASQAHAQFGGGVGGGSGFVANTQDENEASDPGSIMSLEKTLFEERMNLRTRLRKEGTNHPEVRELQQRIDDLEEMLSAQQRKYRSKLLIQFPQADYHEVRGVLEETYEDQLRVVQIQSQNQILIISDLPSRAAGLLMNEVEALVKKLEPAARILPIEAATKSAYVRPVDEVDREFNRKVKELAENYRQANDRDRVSIKAALQELTRQQFEFRHQFRQNEVTLLAARLDRLKENLAVREARKAAIIDQRMRYLTSDDADLKWDDVPPSPDPDSKPGVADPLAESVERNPERPPANPSAAPKATVSRLTLTYQGKSAVEWMSLLETERSDASIADALVALNYLSDQTDAHTLCRNLFPILKTRLTGITTEESQAIAGGIQLLLVKLADDQIVDEFIDHLHAIPSNPFMLRFLQSFTSHYLYTSSLPRLRLPAESTTIFHDKCPQFLERLRNRLPQLIPVLMTGSEMSLKHSAEVLSTLSDLNQRKSLEQFPELMGLAKTLFFDTTVANSPIGVRAVAARILAEAGRFLEEVTDFADQCLSRAFVDEEFQTSTDEYQSGISVILAVIPQLAADSTALQALVSKFDRSLSNSWDRAFQGQTSDDIALIAHHRRTLVNTQHFRNIEFVLLAVSKLGIRASALVPTLKECSSLATPANWPALSAANIGVTRTGTTLADQLESTLQKIGGPEAKQPDPQTPPGKPAPSQSNAATYQDRTIGQWLTILKTERSPQKVLTALIALNHLHDQEDPVVICRALLQLVTSKSLPDSCLDAVQLLFARLMNKDVADELKLQIGRSYANPGFRSFVKRLQNSELFDEPISPSELYPANAVSEYVHGREKLLTLLREDREQTFGTILAGAGNDLQAQVDALSLISWIIGDNQLAVFPKVLDLAEKMFQSANEILKDRSQAADLRVVAGTILAKEGRLIVETLAYAKQELDLSFIDGQYVVDSPHYHTGIQLFIAGLPRMSDQSEFLIETLNRHKESLDRSWNRGFADLNEQSIVLTAHNRALIGDRQRSEFAKFHRLVASVVQFGVRAKSLLPQLKSFLKIANPDNLSDVIRDYSIEYPEEISFSDQLSDAIQKIEVAIANPPATPAVPAQTSPEPNPAKLFEGKTAQEWLDVLESTDINRFRNDLEQTIFALNQLRQEIDPNVVVGIVSTILRRFSHSIFRDPERERFVMAGVNFLFASLADEPDLSALFRMIKRTYRVAAARRFLLSFLMTPSIEKPDATNGTFRWRWPDADFARYSAANRRLTGRIIEQFPSLLDSILEGAKGNPEAETDALVLIDLVKGENRLADFPSLIELARLHAWPPDGPVEENYLVQGKGTAAKILAEAHQLHKQSQQFTSKLLDDAFQGDRYEVYFRYPRAIAIFLSQLPELNAPYIKQIVERHIRSLQYYWDDVFQLRSADQIYLIAEGRMAFDSKRIAPVKILLTSLAKMGPYAKDALPLLHELSSSISPDKSPDLLEKHPKIDDSKEPTLSEQLKATIQKIESPQPN